MVEMSASTKVEGEERGKKNAFVSEVRFARSIRFGLSDRIAGHLFLLKIIQPKRYSIIFYNTYDLRIIY